MRSKICLLLLSLTILSCQKRIVELPETNSQQITEVSDISVAYVFYNEETRDAEFNRKNLIGTTNWLVNVDKRLKLGDALPHLIYLQQKRRKDGMHKNENAKNYFSCSNPDLKNLAFIDFTDVRYHKEPLVEFLKENTSEAADTASIFVGVRSSAEIDIGKNFVLTKTDASSLVNVLNTTIANDSIPDKIYLNFKNDMSFQDYISIKSLLLKIDQDQAKISADEFIYK